jgi:rhomboid protease GluP
MYKRGAFFVFIRTENFRSFLKYYPIVSFIIFLQLILFLLINFVPFGEMVLFLGAGSNLFINEGEYWRFLTPIFIHRDFGHLFFNSFSLVLFGPALEHILGKVKFLLGYIGAGVIASVAVYFIEAATYSHIGASGAIFGLFGIYVYMAIYRKDLIDSANSQIVMTILIIGLIMTFVSPNIAILGHIFGLIGGLLLAPPLLAKR